MKRTKINIYYILGNLHTYIAIFEKDDNQMVDDKGSLYLTKKSVSKKLSYPSIADINEFHSTLKNDLIKFEPVRSTRWVRKSSKKKEKYKLIV